MRRGRARWVRGAAVAAAAAAALGVAAALAWPRLFPDALAAGRAAYARGDWPGAEALAAARLREAPGDREALRLMARSAARRERDEPARALYARLGGASAMGPEDFLLLGAISDRGGDPETARACWTAGLQADPKNPALLYEFARLYLRTAELDRAAAVARQVAGTRGWEGPGNRLLGRALDALDDPAGAADALRRGLDAPENPPGVDGPSADDRKLLARALLRTGRHAEAAARLRDLRAAGPDPEAAWLLGRAALQAGAPVDDPGAEAYRETHPLEPEPAPYVGSARCTGCHDAIHREQQSSRHARTFQRAPGLHGLPLPDGPVPDPARAEVVHSLAATRDGLRFRTREGGATVEAVVAYVFGSGHRARTLVGTDGAGRARELRLSHYADGPVWDVTTGHPAVPPAGEGHLGRVLSADDLDSCLFCHTTAPRPARDRTGPTAADHGIGCERCHGPGGNHLLAVKAGLPDMAIAEPHRTSGAEVVRLCGQCHSPLRKQVTPADPIAVRYPGTTLTWSRCFTESGGTFDCRTCHDAHRDAETSPAFYEARCLGCHAPSKADRTADHVDPRPCPVSPSTGCLPCHMPRTKTLIPHSSFTDHFIRVHPTPPAPPRPAS